VQQGRSVGNRPFNLSEISTTGSAHGTHVDRLDAKVDRERQWLDGWYPITLSCSRIKRANLIN
jgi:hypothetical protein